MVDPKGGWSSLYSNLKGVEVKWTNTASTVTFDKAQGPNTFASPTGNLQRSTAHTWDAHSFHWHSGSEHTVDGKRMELEVHVVHTPYYNFKDDTNNGHPYAVLGLMFDSENYSGEKDRAMEFREKYVDPFFESLKLGEKGPTPNEIKFGDLVNAIQNWDRWTYEGSLTTPPCTQTLHWNVLRRVLPIKAEHVALFKKQLEWADAATLPTTGNWRKTQPINEHKLIFMERPKERDDNMDFTVLIIVLAILTVAFLGSTIFFFMKLRKSKGNSTAVAPATSDRVELVK